LAECTGGHKDELQRCGGCEGQGWTGSFGRFHHDNCNGTGKVCKRSDCGKAMKGDKVRIPA